MNDSPEIPMEMSKEDEEREARWRAESDLRTLVDAEEIKKDSKRMAAAKKMGREQAAALRKVAKS